MEIKIIKEKLEKLIKLDKDFSIFGSSSHEYIINPKLTDECMKYGISANDLTFKLRSAGVYHISSLKRVVLEQNGQFTIVQIDEKDNIKYPLIADGQINEDVLELIQKDKEWVFEKSDIVFLILI
jgi:uncharacterized membrane protein YcaP (DUF421 family)